MFVSFISQESVLACKMHHHEFFSEFGMCCPWTACWKWTHNALLPRMLSISGNWYANYAKPSCWQSHNRGSAIILKNKNNDRFPPIPTIRYCWADKETPLREKVSENIFIPFPPHCCKKVGKKLNKPTTNFPEVTHESVTGPKKNLIPATN